MLTVSASDAVWGIGVWLPIAFAFGFVAFGTGLAFCFWLGTFRRVMQP